MPDSLTQRPDGACPDLADTADTLRSALMDLDGQFGPMELTHRAIRAVGALARRERITDTDEVPGTLSRDDLGSLLELIARHQEMALRSCEQRLAQALREGRGG